MMEKYTLDPDLDCEIIQGVTKSMDLWKSIYLNTHITSNTQIWTL